MTEVVKYVCKKCNYAEKATSKDKILKSFSELFVAFGIVGLFFFIFLILFTLTKPTSALNMYENVQFASQESNSIEIKQIVANETKQCFNYNNYPNNTNGYGDYCIAKSLYEWVTSNISYAKLQGTSQADETVKLKTGDCADASVLYCSLIKEAGLNCGYIYIQGGADGGHVFNWVTSGHYAFIVDTVNSKFEVASFDGG